MTQNEGVHPFTNRGVQNTYHVGLKSLVDWFSVTFRFGDDVRKIIEIFGLSELEFMETGGKNGYSQCLRNGHMAFYYGGHGSNMGVWVDFSGQGCREFEQIKDLDWAEFFNHLICNEGRFSRLDIAVDDFTPMFKISKLTRALRDGRCKSKMKRARRMETIDIADGKSCGETLYFGMPSSDIQIRFYEKDYERLLKGFDLPEDMNGWNRTEIQSRRKRAQKIAEIIAENKISVGEVVQGILKQYLNVLADDRTDSNKSRQRVAKWWEKFLGNVEKLKLAEKAPDPTIERKENWINKSVAPTLGALFYAYDGNMDKIAEILNDGMERIDEVTLNLVEEYKKRKTVADEQRHKKLEEKRETILTPRIMADVKDSSEYHYIS